LQETGLFAQGVVADKSGHHAVVAILQPGRKRRARAGLNAWLWAAAVWLAILLIAALVLR
jgi:hypothetical protein